MSWNGVEIRNDIGAQVDGFTGALHHKQCFVCQDKVRLGDEVLYLFKQRGTQSATSGYLHLKCLPQIRLDGKAGSVACRGYQVTVRANLTYCVGCGERGCTFVGLTQQRVNVGFHEKCIKDERLSPQDLEVYKVKRQKTLERSVVCKRDRFEMLSEDKESSITMHLITRTRRDGKLVEASCNIVDYTRTPSRYIEEKIVLFSCCKWRRQRGELRLQLLLNWPNEIRQKIIEYLDRLQDGYDNRGYEKVRVPVEC